MEVSDADREAAVSLAAKLSWSNTICIDVLNGTCEYVNARYPEEYVEQVDVLLTLARHREQALSTQAAELDALRGEVETLRKVVAKHALEVWKNLPPEARNEELSYIMGFNAGWETAVEQIGIGPTVANLPKEG